VEHIENVYEKQNGRKRPTSPALLNTHREIYVDIEKVIDRFAIKHQKQMVLVDILNSNPHETPCQ
jgi:hypothetical protein